jgi:hypothetical protein
MNKDEMLESIKSDLQKVLEEKFLGKRATKETSANMKELMLQHMRHFLYERMGEHHNDKLEFEGTFNESTETVTITL